MIATSDIDRVTGSKVVDRDGDKVGTVNQVYIDAEDGRPLFATVNTGFFGTSESFVPLEGADFRDGGLRVAFDKATIKGAPNVAADGDLDDAEQDRIFDYYGVGGAGAASGTAGDGAQAPVTDRATGTDRVTDTAGTADTADTDGRTSGVDTASGHDTSGPTTDDAMTRSEERLRVGTQQVETGRARRRKHVVTEQQTVSVPVSHDEVRIEREPITDADIGDATGGPTLSEEEHEVVLTAEEPVVAKDTVPVERVKLGTETVAEERTVTADVRKEQIEIDGDDSSRK